MWVILLEALAALLLLIGLVWWTMFSGRKGGERRVEAPPPSGRASEEPSGPAPVSASVKAKTGDRRDI